MTDTTNPRRRFLLQATLSAASGAAGAASIAFAPSLAAAALPAPSAPGGLLALAAAPAHGAGLPQLVRQQVRTDALEIDYLAIGPESGRPIVLAHDIGHRSDSYAEVAALLAAQGFQVLLPSLRGHGETRLRADTVRSPATPTALGQDLIDFIDALHMPEAVFVGTGLGAYAAQMAARVRRSRCVGLVLAGADEALTPALPNIHLAPDALPQQTPRAFADAAATIARQGKWRT